MLAIQVPQVGEDLASPEDHFLTRFKLKVRVALEAKLLQQVRVHYLEEFIRRLQLIEVDLKGAQILKLLYSIQ